MTDHSRHVKHLRPRILHLKRREAGWTVVCGRTGEPLLMPVSSLKAVTRWMELQVKREGAIVDQAQVERELDRAADRAVRWARQESATVIPFPLERRR